MSQIQRGCWLGLLLSAALLSGCGTNPVTGKSELHLVSEQQEIGIGQKQYQPSQQAMGGLLVIDPDLTSYVREVGSKLAKVSDRPTLPYEFNVVNDSTPNAWALPGGKIAINRGLLTELKSEAELAAVLGHEIVHAAARHGASAMERQVVLAVGAAVLSATTQDSEYRDLIGFAVQGGAAMIGMKFSREHELEADHYGVKTMVRAGYDPNAAVSLQETFVRLSGDKKPNWLAGLFASHPPSQERVEANRAMLASFPGGFVDGKEAYQKRMALLTKTKPAYDAYDEGRKLLAKEPKQALEKAEKALAIEPREANFHALKADALKKLGKPADAEKSYDKALSLNPSYYALHLNRGVLRQERGNKEGARGDFERANALLPTAVAHAGLGKLAQDAGERDKAIAHFRLAAASNTDAGLVAGKALAKLDMPSNPGAYFQTYTASDGFGNLSLVVVNRSAVTVRNVRLMVQIGNGLPREFQIDGPLKSQQSDSLPLRIRQAELQGAKINGRVLSAAVTE